MSMGKKWRIAACIMLAAGALFMIGAAVAVGFDLNKLSTVKFVENTYELGNDIKEIDVNADTENISFALSEDEECRVVCYEEEDDLHYVGVKNGTLSIGRAKKRKYKFGIFMDSPKITVYLPAAHYGRLSVNADTGNVYLPKDISFDEISIELDTGNISCSAKALGNISLTTDTGSIKAEKLSAKSMRLEADTGRIDLSDIAIEEDINISVSTGRVTIKNAECSKLVSEGDTGDLIMTDVIAAESFDLKRDTGDIKFDHCDAENITVETDTGSVSGTLLSEKIFLVQSDLGRIDVPKSTTGGRCEITTDTGNIKISIE